MSQKLYAFKTSCIYWCNLGNYHTRCTVVWNQDGFPNGVFFLLHLSPFFPSVSFCLSLWGHRPGGHEVDRVSVDQIRLTLGHPLSAEKQLRAGHWPVFLLTTNTPLCVCICMYVCVCTSHLLSLFHPSCQIIVFYGIRLLRLWINENSCLNCCFYIFLGSIMLFFTVTPAKKQND